MTVRNLDVIIYTTHILDKRIPMKNVKFLEALA